MKFYSVLEQAGAADPNVQRMEVLRKELDGLSFRLAKLTEVGEVPGQVTNTAEVKRLNTEIARVQAEIARLKMNIEREAKRAATAGPGV